jgi:hypothetical protein
MSTINLPGGHIATIREKVTVGGQQLLQREGMDMFAYVRKTFPGATNIADIAEDNLTGEMMQHVQKWQKASVLALLKSWTLPQPLPTADTITDLEIDVWEALVSVTAPLAMTAMSGVTLSPQLAKNGTIDRENPTQTSSDSKEHAEVAATPSTGQVAQSLSVTENIATVA